MFFLTVFTASFLLSFPSAATATSHRHQHQHLHTLEKRGALCTETHIYYDIVYETVYGTATEQQPVIDLSVPSTVLTCPAQPTVTLTWTPPVVSPVIPVANYDQPSIGGPGGDPANYGSQTTTLEKIQTTTTAAAVEVLGGGQNVPEVVTTSSTQVVPVVVTSPSNGAAAIPTTQGNNTGQYGNDPNAVPIVSTTTTSIMVVPTTTNGQAAGLPVTTTTTVPGQVAGNVNTTAPGVSPPVPGVSPPVPGVSPPVPGVSPPVPGVSPPVPGVSPPVPGVSPVVPVAGSFGTPQTPGNAEACAAACNAAAPGAFPGSPYPRTPAVCAVKGTECSKGTPCVSLRTAGAPGMSFHEYTTNPTGDYCGIPINTATEYHIVAVGWPHMGTNSNHGTGRPKDANCGRKVLITVFPGTPQATENYAYVVDRCEACEHGLDASKELFQEMTKNVGLGRVDVSWHFED